MNSKIGIFFRSKMMKVFYFYLLGVCTSTTASIKSTNISNMESQSKRRKDSDTKCGLTCRTRRMQAGYNIQLIF